jgi:DNA polymerase-3 subunit alpha/error-prone DNA polymerase
MKTAKPPDDIDWSWQERDVILEYIFLIVMGTKMWLCGTNVEFKYRSIFKSEAKFLVYKEELDHLAKTPCVYSNNSVVKVQNTACY